MESTVDPSEFQKIVGSLMKAKYTAEQRVADSGLSRQRQRKERIRCESRTSDRRRSLSNTSLGSRVAQQQQQQQQLQLQQQQLQQQKEQLQKEQQTQEQQSINSKSAGFLLADDASLLRMPSRSNQFPSGDKLSPHRCSLESGAHKNICAKEYGENEPEQNATPRQWSPLRSPTPLRTRVVMSTSNDEAKFVAPQSSDCSRCMVLEKKVKHMQETLDTLLQEMRALAAHQKMIEGQPNDIVRDNASSMNGDTSSEEVPGSPDKLGKNAEEKFLTVVTILAKRVRRLESDLTATLDQIRVMDAAVIERDAHINKSKVERSELDDAVFQALKNVQPDISNEKNTLYHLWGLDSEAVRKALSSPDPDAATNLVLGTPPFARILRTVMDNNNEILALLHEQQLRNSGHTGNGSNAEFASPLAQLYSGRHGGARAAGKGPAALHELLLGINLRDERNVLGVRVVSVAMGSPAAHAVSPGDVVTHINRVTVRSIADVSYVLSRAKPGAPVRLAVQAPDSRSVEMVQVLPKELA